MKRLKVRRVVKCPVKNEFVDPFNVCLDEKYQCPNVGGYSVDLDGNIVWLECASDERNSKGRVKEHRTRDLNGD